MSLILNIDTSLATASVSLARNGELLQSAQNGDQMDHAAWLHPAIDRLLRQGGHPARDLEAVAVSIGPGSYTGLRIGLSAAKGLCYALGIPLLTIGTLELLAFSVMDQAEDLICPLVDARRMEVFTAVYDKNLNEKTAPLAMILHINSFESLLAHHKILFCGNATGKLEAILSNDNARFVESSITASALATLADRRHQEKRFADLAYTEPLYLKEFHSPLRKG